MERPKLYVPQVSRGANIAVRVAVAGSLLAGCSRGSAKTVDYSQPVISRLSSTRMPSFNNVLHQIHSEGPNYVMKRVLGEPTQSCARIWFIRENLLWPGEDPENISALAVASVRIRIADQQVVIFRPEHGITLLDDFDGRVVYRSTVGKSERLPQGIDPTAVICAWHIVHRTW